MESSAALTDCAREMFADRAYGNAQLHGDSSWGNPLIRSF